ncbi:MAG: polyprenyl synthetase family protein [Planctomycetes bacterium]|nr:polyprenyl synthetase family protein [Planctomycetota bacterium]
METHVSDDDGGANRACWVLFYMKGENVSVIDGDITLKNRLLEYRGLVNSRLENMRPFSSASTLENAFEAAIFPGGKRLRPMLSILCGDIFNGVTNGLVDVAASVELLHIASLILDDLPSMDNADERRGKPSLHKVYTPHLAVLCGHGMVSQAMYLTTQAKLPDNACRKIVAELARCIGPHGMAAGQADDLEGVFESAHDNLLKIAAWKTGCLFRAAAYCGAVAGGASDADAAMLGECGLHFGIAYQIADDLDDVDGEDDPMRSFNIATLIGVDDARVELEKETSHAQRLAAKAKGSDALIRFIGMLQNV